MFEDPDLWLVLASLAITAIALGRWITKAGDDWLHSQLETPCDIGRDNAMREHSEQPEKTHP